jgi:ribosomal protein L21E
LQQLHKGFKGVKVMPDFKKGQKVRIQVRSSTGEGKRKKKILAGTIVESAAKFIVIQTKNYRECINSVDLLTGAAVVLEASMNG